MFMSIKNIYYNFCPQQLFLLVQKYFFLLKYIFTFQGVKLFLVSHLKSDSTMDKKRNDTTKISLMVLMSRGN
jgi:hypothetical protein